MSDVSDQLRKIQEDLNQPPMTLEEFEQFYDGLTDMDRANFTTLVSLPNVFELLCTMDNGDYKRAVVFALAAKQILEVDGDDQ